MKARKNFCSRPFTSLFTMNFGEYKICCDSAKMGDIRAETITQAWNNPRWKQVRQSFIKDERPAACQVCWKREDLGITSGRDQKSAETIEHILQNYDENGFAQNFPKTISFRLGSKCNLKCIMCAPYNSSKWNEDLDLFQSHIDSKNHYVEPPSAFEADTPLEIFNHVEHLTFIGGEPLLINSHLLILDHLIGLGRADQVTLKYFTNTTLLPDWTQEYWSQFKRIELRSSFDGTREVFEYVRFPGKWHTIESVVEKINRLRLRDLDYGISFVFMNVNAFALADLFRWRNSRSWLIRPPTIRPDYIENPDFLRPELLSSTQLSKLIHTLKELQEHHTLYDEEKRLLGDLVTQLTSENPAKSDSELGMKRLISYLDALDRRRNLSSRQVLPHLFEEALAAHPLQELRQN